MDPSCECEEEEEKQSSDYLGIPVGGYDGLSPRRTSGASSVSGISTKPPSTHLCWTSWLVNSYLGYCSEGADRDRSMSGDSTALRLKRRILHQISTDDGLSWIPETVCGASPRMFESKKSEPKAPTMCHPDHSCMAPVVSHIPAAVVPSESSNQNVNAKVDTFLSIPTSVATSVSEDTLTGDSNYLKPLSGSSSPSNLSSHTLTGSTGSGSQDKDKDLTPTQENQSPLKYGRAPSSPLPERKFSRNDIQPTIVTQPQTNPPTVTTTHYGDVSATKSDKKHDEIPVIHKPTPASTTSTESSVTTSSIISSTVSSIFGGGLQPNLNYLSMNRRPSAGANVIPVAALCQHRHSLQLNGSDIGTIHRVGCERSSSRSRAPKTPEKTRKYLFGVVQTPQKEAPRFVERPDFAIMSFWLA